MPLKNIFVILGLFIAVQAAAQDQIVAKGDTLVLPNGSKYWLGEHVTLGTGSLPDGSFNFVYFPVPLNIAKKQTLRAGYAGRKATVKKFQRDGEYKKSYSYNILVLVFDDNDPRRYWCDVQGAVNSNEIVNNAKENKVAVTESKETRLAKLKKLYDSGEITKDEYETLRNKILNEKAPPKKDDGPAVF